MKLTGQAGIKVMYHSLFHDVYNNSSSIFSITILINPPPWVKKVCIHRVQEGGQSKIQFQNNIHPEQERIFLGKICLDNFGCPEETKC